MLSLIGKRRECPRWESNLGFDLRRVACKIHHTPRTNCSAPCRGIERASGRFEVCHAVHHTRRVCVSVARPGIEPGPTASEADMLSGTLTGHIVKGVATWNRNRTKTFGESATARAPCAAWSAVVGCPLHHRDTRADDWIRTSINRFTGPRLSQSSHVGIRQECKESNPAGRFWRPLASQKHTPVFHVLQGDRRESNPYLLLHRQTCVPRTPRTPC